jgi:hypothetical protein
MNSYRTVLLLLTLALTLLLPGTVSARIPEHPAQVDIPRLASTATTMFRGVVSTIVPGETTIWGTKGAIAQFAVDRWYRGTGPAIVDVRFSYDPQMAINGHDCINLQPGSHWIVFASGKGEPLQMVHDCEGALTVSPRLALETLDTNDWLSLMVDDFAAGLQDSSSEARIASIQRLGNLRSRQSRPFLQSLLKMKDGEEYEWAVYAALRAGDIRVLPAVTELLQNYPEQHVPESFMPREIMDITDKAAIPDLLAILHGGVQGSRAAIVALSQIGGRYVLPDIAPHLADSDRQVRYQAMAAIQKLLPSPACDVVPFAPEEQIDAKERECLAWWQQVGAGMVR